MAQVKMEHVKELRDRTQAGINDCRAALVESDGDMEKAVEVILKKGLAKSAKRAGAVATEGIVLTRIADGGKLGVIVEVNIQTDFAARNEEFKAFVERVADAAMRAKAGAELGAEPYPGGPGSVEDQRAALVGKLGENITLRRWARLAVDGAGMVHSYVHMGGKIGALLAVRSASEKAAQAPAFKKFVDDTAMQIAAMAPLYTSAAEVPASAKQKQSEIFDSQLAEEGKPEKARPKIVEGKIAKWLKEVCLLEQPSVLDGEHTVDGLRAALAKELGSDVSVAGFVRYERGEGIEKAPPPDFAAEVAKMTGL